jgi:predicted RNA-binding Zn-ribbon protein involved in translation (DUF1610 family)
MREQIRGTLRQPSGLRLSVSDRLPAWRHCHRPHQPSTLQVYNLVDACMGGTCPRLTKISGADQTIDSMVSKVSSERSAVHEVPAIPATTWDIRTWVPPGSYLGIVVSCTAMDRPWTNPAGSVAAFDHRLDAAAKTCPYCGRPFVKTNHLERHLRSHTKEKPFRCDDCGKRYSR